MYKAGRRCTIAKVGLEYFWGLGTPGT